MNVDIFPSKMLRWCLVCVICTVIPTVFIPLYSTLHNDCSHIEDMHPLFCAHCTNIVFIFWVFVHTLKMCTSYFVSISRIFFQNLEDIFAHLSRRLNVSYCDRSMSVVPPSVNFFLKQHLLNNWSKFHIISHECLYDALIQNCLNGSTLPNRRAAKAPVKKSFKQHLLTHWHNLK